MIDFDNFHFACPPRTGGGWFIKACDLVGIKFVGNDVNEPFSTNESKSVLKVSLVRNPYDWLASCYSAVRAGARIYFSGSVTGFHDLNLDGFGFFIRDYLYHSSGYLSKLFLSYKADTYMRLEDMPWAFMEFMESFGVPEYKLQLCKDLRRQNVSGEVIYWDSDLRESIRTTESEIFNTFEYF